MTMFTGKVRTEGLKGYLILAIPAALKFPEGWVRLDLPKAKPCFLYARGRERRMCLPSWNFPDLKAGNIVEARVAPAGPYRARGEHAGCFDWLAFVGGDERTFATEEPGGILKLWSRYSAPFELLRCPPIEMLYRVLGFYQAEGSKGATGNDFSFANSSVELLRNAIENLAAIGIGNNQLYAEILQGVGESRESAMAKYESLPLEVVAVRPRSGKGGSAYVVHAHNSKPFRGMVIRALAHVFANEFPCKEAARAFALSWLDGDGNITLSGLHTELRLAGLPDEHRVVCRALNLAFEWTLENERYRDNKQGTHIVLRASEMLDLIEVQAFRFSMNYVRLLLGFDSRTASLRGPRRGPLARWGLLQQNGELTDVGARICIGHYQHQEEIERARQLVATSPELFGVKGLPNPLLPPKR